MLARTRLFLALLLVMPVLFSSCKKEDESVDEVRFDMQVVDDLGSKISGAEVYIYDSQAAYENALSSGDYSSATFSGITIGTGTSFLLKGNQEYWIFAKFFDSGRNYVLTNSGNGKIEKLEKGSKLDVKVFIAPISGNIAFWTKPGNSLPITIRVNGVSQPLLTTTMAAAPVNPGDPNAINVNMLAGTYNYQATSDNGCLWANSVTITRGGFQAIELSTCVRGRVSFTNSSYEPAHGPINVVLDNNDNVGFINGPGSYGCLSGSNSGSGNGGGSFISVTRDKNNYTYVAKSQDGQCEWVGSFQIQSDTCISINLPACSATSTTATAP